MKTPTPDEAFDDEFSERLVESLEELKASYEKLHSELKPAITNHSQQLEEIQGQVHEIQSRIRRRWREIVLLDDNGIEHRIPKGGIMHMAYVTRPVSEGTTVTFPLPKAPYPCLRVFSASFPGVCYDFRVKGEIPIRVIRGYSKTLESSKKVLNDRAFLNELASRFTDGGDFTLEAQKFGADAGVSIKVGTYQYLH